MTNGSDASGLDLLTTDEAARLLRTTRSTLEKWRGQEQGPTFLKIQGRVYYDLEDVKTWVNGLKRPVPVKP